MRLASAWTASLVFPPTKFPLSLWNYLVFVCPVFVSQYTLQIFSTMGSPKLVDNTLFTQFAHLNASAGWLVSAHLVTSKIDLDLFVQWSMNSQERVGRYLYTNVEKHEQVMTYGGGYCPSP